MNIVIAFSLGTLIGAILMVVVAVIVIDEKNQREGWRRGTNVPYRPTTPKMPAPKEKTIKSNGNVAQDR